MAFGKFMNIYTDNIFHVSVLSIIKIIPADAWQTDTAISDRSRRETAKGESGGFTPENFGEHLLNLVSFSAIKNMNSSN